MDKKERLEQFKKLYFFFEDELKEDSRKLKGIEDVVKKYHEVCRMVGKHKNNESILSGHYNAGKSNTIEDSKYFGILQEFSEKVRQLEKMKSELAKMDEVKKDIEKREN